jgi:quercetin dioxygenase-like cupin family protein
MTQPVPVPAPVPDLSPVPNRPGMQARTIVGSEQGFSTLFLSEMLMQPGAVIPLHTHPVEEAFVVTAGELAFRLGDATVVATADLVVRIPPGVPHAVRNDSAQPARAYAAAAWDRATWFTRATSYLEGRPRLD